MHGLLTNKNKNSGKKKFDPRLRFLGFFKCFFENFEGYSADTCAIFFLLVSMGGRAEGLAFANLGAGTPIGASGNCLESFLQTS